VPSDFVAKPEVAGPEGLFLPHGWAPDGSVLATMVVARRNTDNAITDTDIVKFRPEPGAAVEPIVRTPALEGDWGVALSPDGRWLAYTSTATGRAEVWVQPLAGSGPL